MRGLDSKGLKNALSQRLSEAIGKEKENDEKNENQGGQPQEKLADEAMPDTEQQQNLVNKEVSKEQQQEAKPNEQQQSPAQKSNTEPSIMVKIKEEIIELMETDEAV